MVLTSQARLSGQEMLRAKFRNEFTQTEGQSSCKGSVIYREGEEWVEGGLKLKRTENAGKQKQTFNGFHEFQINLP